MVPIRTEAQSLSLEVLMGQWKGNFDGGVMGEKRGLHPAIKVILIMAGLLAFLYGVSRVLALH